MEENPNFSLEFTRQEYPCFGTTDFRQPAFEIFQENGSHISDYQYAGYRITAGKPDLKGLPHSYTQEDSEAETLEITLVDSLTKGELVLSYTIFADLPVIARSALFVNKGEQTLRLNRAMSMSVDFPDHDFEWMQFSGAWGRERAPKVRKLEMGVTAIESMRGHSSAHENPFVILKRPNTDEDSGEAFGFSFVYSGNFLAQAEVDTYDVTRFTMGINPRGFSWKLTPGESFQTPEVLMTYSNTGLNGLSNSLHTLLRSRVARGYWRDRPRPVLLNNWEATGMEFTEESVLNIARKGAEVGVELFVLDDGWFGHRTETSGLGDWFVDKSKLPNGVKGLADKVNALGMNFGIWIEPEMVNEDSELYRTHPEFVLATPDRRKSLGRSQLVLDFSNPAVVDYIYNMLVKAFDGANISYIKWDMNRSITECYSTYWSKDQQGEVYHRYILGVYSLYEKLLAKYPHLLFESCASGGSRFDAGMLYYAPQAWCSDDTDAAERVKIQYGSSYGYPISSWGSHVSECPNQQLGRTTPLSTRANVAFFGAFGYEMDLNALSDQEIEQVKEQVKFMKEHRALIQFGSFYRLENPYQGQQGAWMVVSQDKSEAIVGLYQLMNRINSGFIRLHLRGLDPEKDYHINGSETAHGGDELMEAGLFPVDAGAHPMEAMFGGGKGIDISCDYDSCLYHLTSN
jgi:alpha-galactosidase